MTRDLNHTRPAAIEAGQSLQAVQMGRPPARYTVGVHQQICENIKKGARPVTAAQMAGIPSHMFYRWMNLGRNGDPHLYQFVEDVDLAIGVFEGRMTEKVVESTEEDPKQAQWVLERRFPEGYSKDVDAKVNAILANFMVGLKENLTTDEYYKVMAIKAGFAGSLESSPPKPLQLTINAESELEEPQENSDSTGSDDPGGV